jgi:hypothetical protein
MKAQKQHRRGKAWWVGNQLVMFLLLSAIFLANFPQTPGSYDSMLLNRMGLAPSLVTQNRLFRPAISTNGIRKTSVFFHAFQYGTISSIDFPVTLPSVSRLIRSPLGTISSIDFPVTLPSVSRLIRSPHANIAASMFVACGNPVRAPPQGLLFQLLAKKSACVSQAKRRLAVGTFLPRYFVRIASNPRKQFMLV